MSSHTPRVKPKPRYARPESAGAPANFNSTLDIRDSVYEQWYAERMVSARQEKADKLRQEKEEEEKKKRVIYFSVI